MNHKNTRRGNTQQVINKNYHSKFNLESHRFLLPKVRSRIKYGMISLFDNRGFTLIELLVVVLILGILAAVALPQYQKAVAKSRAMEILVLVRSAVPAVREYILANEKFPTTFDELSVAPNGTLKKFFVEHDQVESGNTKVTMVYGRLDASLITPNDQTPSFIYPTEFSTWSTFLEPNHLYCVHNYGNEKQKAICSSLGTLVKNEGEDTRFFKID